MSSPRWPDVYAGLLALLPKLAGFSDVMVFDGQPITGDNPMAWVTVGFVTDDGAGSFQQDRDPSGFATTESGEIVCHVAFNAGETDPSITRGRAFAYVGAWQTALELDPTIGGVIPAGSVVNLSTDVLQPQNSAGSAASLLVTVSYETTTFFNP